VNGLDFAGAPAQSAAHCSYQQHATAGGAVVGAGASPAYARRSVPRQPAPANGLHGGLEGLSQSRRTFKLDFGNVLSRVEARHDGMHMRMLAAHGAWAAALPSIPGPRSAPWRTHKSVSLKGVFGTPPLPLPGGRGKDRDSNFHFVFVSQRTGDKKSPHRGDAGRHAAAVAVLASGVFDQALRWPQRKQSRKACGASGRRP